MTPAQLDETCAYVDFKRLQKFADVFCGSEKQQQARGGQPSRQPRAGGRQGRGAGTAEERALAPRPFRAVQAPNGRPRTAGRAAADS